MTDRNINAIGRRADVYADWIGAESGFVVGRTWGRPAPRRQARKLAGRVRSALLNIIIKLAGR